MARKACGIVRRRLAESSRRALHPLCGVGFVGVRGEAHGEAGEAADAFGAHGVSLVGHRGGADLVGFEGLFDFFAMGEDAEVGRGFVAAGGDAGEGVEDLGVDLAGVGLSGDGVGAGEAHLFRDRCFELADFGVVAVEELEEAGLGSGGAFDAAGEQ